MAAPMEAEFSSWLSKKLQEINPDVDLDIFVPYLTGILETEETDKEELEESIQGFLAQITEDNLEEHCASIISEWNNYSGQEDASAKKEKAKSLEQKLASIREQQNQTVAKTKELSAEDLERLEAKKAILAQYAQVSDGEETDSDQGSGDEGGAKGDSFAEDSLAKNMNSQLVLQREKEQRDKAKEASDQKRQKDKEDREKQKDKAKERKEAEKKRTQKGERRR